MPGAQYYDGKKLNIPITDESAKELHERWMTQALSCIMSAVANKKSQHLNEYHRNKLFKCSKDATDIQEHAECVVAALDAPKRRNGQHSRREGRFQKLKGMYNTERKRALGEIIWNSTYVPSNQNWKDPVIRSKYRTKREVVRRSHYKLYSEYENMTPFGVIGKHLANTIKIAKRKKPERSWEMLLADLAQKQMEITETQKFREALKNRIASITGSSKKLSQVEKRLKEAMNIKTEASNKKEQDEESMRLIRSALKLAMILSGDNRTNLLNRTLKIASPRLLSIMPDEIKDEIDILSPSLFSLHSKGKGTEALMSLPSLTKTVRMKDFDEWLEFIIEASGVSDAIDFAADKNVRFDYQIRNGPRGIDNQPLYFTKENVTEIAGAQEGHKVEIFESLARALKPKQLSELHRDGYSIMTQKQLELVYGQHSPYNDSSLLARFLAMNETTIRQGVITSIRELAARRSDVSSKRTSRVKREILVLSPIVLGQALFIWTPATISLTTPTPALLRVILERLKTPMMEAISLKILRVVIFAIFACAEIEYTRETMPGAQFYDGKKIRIPISDEAGHEMYERWAMQGISSIISAIASEKVEILNEYHRNRLYKCSQKSEDIYEQASCLVDAIDVAESQVVKSKTKGSHLRKLESVLKRTNGISMISNGRFLREENALGLNRNRTETIDAHDDRPIVEFRTKREVVKRTHYKLRTEYENLTPFGLFGKYLSQTAKQVKHKHKDKSMGSIIAEIELLQSKIKQRKEMEASLKKKFQFAKYGAAQLFARNGISETERALMDNVGMPNDMGERARVDNEIRQKQTNLTMGLLRRGMQLAMAISGNKTDISNKTLKIASPRLLSVVPEELENNIALLSPSLFSLHNKGHGTEALLSLPHVIQSTENKDYEQWINFIMETSGVSDAVDKVLKNDFEKLGFNFLNEARGIDNQPLYFTKDNITEIGGEYERRKVEVFETLTKTLTRKQIAEFNTTGFSVLTPEQLQLVYGEQSPFNNSEALERFSQMDEWTIKKALLQNLRDLAKKKTHESGVGLRRKRAIVLSPLVNGIFINAGDVLSTPLVLSPVLFALVVFTPAVFGAVILSPWLFVAVILSPRLMSPVILAPVSLSTAVLTPVCMNPTILSAGALVPFVLSPLVLCPNILSPTVLSPAILSPFALGGNILNPVAVTAIVLSPFVLAPSVCSPAYVAALVLSPHALSPLINSTGKAVTLILSPSAFS